MSKIIDPVLEKDPDSAAPFLQNQTFTLNVDAKPTGGSTKVLSILEPLPVYKQNRSKSIDVVSLQIIHHDNESDDEPNEKRKQSISSVGRKELGWRRYLGLIYTIISVNMISLTSTIMKKYYYIHPFNVGIFSSPASTVVTCLAILYTVKWEKQSVLTGLKPFKEHKKDIFFLTLRAILSSVISYITIYAFSFVSAADVRTVVAAAVITVYIFGWMFLGEKCGVVPIVVALVALCGIGIMTRPPALTGAKEFDQNTLIGIGLAFSAMMIISIQLIIIRHLNKLHHGVTNLIVYLWGFLQGVVLAFSFGVFKVPEWSEILGLMVAGVFLALALAFLVLALQQEEAGVVALIRTSEVIFVFIWQMIIVGTYPDLISISGAVLVVSGVVAVTLRKWVESLPPGNSNKKRLAFLLW